MAPPSGRRRILPFRVPFFRIFYSTTYTLLYIFTLAMLLITPASMIYSAVEAYAFQYIFMIGGVYILLAAITIFIYFSRLYTNRTVLVGVGKAYLPIEKGEVGKQVRKMIVKQMERSAIVAWESRPRDLYGEILAAEKEGLLPPEAGGVGRNDYTLGRIIQIDPARPPWRIVRHPGWSSPSQRDDNQYPNVQFSDVIAELPNLIEARAVSLAPADPTMTPRDGRSIADPAVADLLTRPATMAMRDYITQLSYLGLMNPPETAQTFLRQYEHARFCGRPCTEDEFAKLMATFSDLLAGMVGLEPAIIEQIRAQTGEDAASMSSAEADPLENRAQLRSGSTAAYRTPSPVPAHSPASSVLRSPVTAREALSCDITPFATHQHGPSGESFGSVIHYAPNPAEDEVSRQRTARSSSLGSASMVSFASDAGSVIRHSAG
ncbi:hypothetical protein LTR91_021789 [Friedmanniomyces endolithicus]|uniref:Defect at low temperature protein 1 n=1 Tax=Friedmanniomyces endolithicus TaxID=329885 RepID=A0AAN6FDR8_9PEZI|nr:hypothetical protein LTR82_013206 [Friedmanniomyces endolithicus]KAK0957592.1 hypothetical protein LTR91_021789 [Friedmanniomyces endolithicus]KAK0984298.1 hypothetical protein LTS01_010745 [Friedmanniomyces endolithicus]KAK1042319.1 hypothetical protein LTS16_008927 [Friedmanniomyces endolithicus]